MKLPISLLLLVALRQAASSQSEAKSSDDKSAETKRLASASKQKDSSQTSKRELFEGNFGERKDGLLTKYGATGASSGIQYAQDLKNVLPDQSPTHQTFGARLPQIAKISDVLTGQGPFEAAVANHLYAPLSVYQARISSPTLFEVPAAAASQRAYPNPKAYRQHKPAEDNKKLQELPTKEAELPRVNFNNAPVFAVKQPTFNQHFDSFGPKFSRQPSSLPQDILYQPRTFSRTSISSLFPLVYDQLGPIKYQGDLLPSQFLHQQGVYRLLPVGPSNQEQIGEKDYINPGIREELQAEPTQRPKLQNIPVPKQGYHAHPNGAISFASFSQNLLFNTQPELLAAPQSQAAKPLTQQQLEELSSQYQALAHRPHLQKQKIQYTPISHKYIQQVPKYQPEPQFITLQQPIQNQPRAINPLHRLIFQDPPHLRKTQTIQFQRLPAFKPLPQSQLTAESLFQTSTTSPYVPLTHVKPKSNNYQDLSTPNPNNIDQQLSLVLPQQNFTPLPPLKPNYNQYVKPLDVPTRTSPIFLPTPLQPLPSSTPKLQLDADQVISSTTIQPDIKDHEEYRDATANAEIQPQSPTPQSFKPEIIHQSQPTGLPLSFQSTTQQPISKYESQSEHVQHSSPRPEYQSTIDPHPIQTSPRHEVIIQQQELQELVLEPSPQPSSALNYQSQSQQNHQAQETHQLQSQQLLTELDQLRNQEFQQGLQELLTRQYQQGARQLQYLQQQSIEQLEPQQYQNQQHLETQQLQPQPPIQQQQNEPEQSQQQNTEQIQPQQYQNEHPEPQNQNESTTNPTQEIQKRLEQLQHLSQSQPQTNQPQFKTTTGEPHDPQEKAPSPTEPNPTPDFGRYLDPILTHLQPVLPDIYAQPQELVTQPGLNQNFGAPTFADVQYFGKYAQSLFGGH